MVQLCLKSAVINGIAIDSYSNLRLACHRRWLVLGCLRSRMRRRNFLQKKIASRYVASGGEREN